MSGSACFLAFSLRFPLSSEGLRLNALTFQLHGDYFFVGMDGLLRYLGRTIRIVARPAARIPGRSFVTE